MGLDVSEVRGVVERVFAQRDVLEACARRDLGTLVAILGTHGVTQGLIAGLTGISQGRLSEWATHKRTPVASRSFEAFADGLGIPAAAARQALRLAPVPSAGARPGPERSLGAGSALPAQVPSPRSSGAGLSGLQSLEEVRGQLDAVIGVLKSEQDRRRAGAVVVVRRPAWKNLVFTGPAWSGKSRTAATVGEAYRKLGVLSVHVSTLVVAVETTGNLRAELCCREGSAVWADG